MPSIFVSFFCLTLLACASDSPPQNQGPLSPQKCFELGLTHLLGEQDFKQDLQTAKHYFSLNLNVGTNPTNLDRARLAGILVAQQTDNAADASRELASFLIKHHPKNKQTPHRVIQLLTPACDKGDPKSLFFMSEIYYRDLVSGLGSLAQAKSYMTRARAARHPKAKLALKLISRDFELSQQTPNFSVQSLEFPENFTSLWRQKSQRLYTTSSAINFCLGVQCLVSDQQGKALMYFSNPLVIKNVIPNLIYPELDLSYPASATDQNRGFIVGCMASQPGKNQAKALYQLGQICQYQAYSIEYSYRELVLHLFRLSLDLGYEDAKDDLALAQFRQNLPISSEDSTSKIQRIIHSWSRPSLV